MAGQQQHELCTGDSIITEDKDGRIGIGTAAPTSKLTVQGMIETTLGGVKFPDGTVQTTTGIAFVTHDATLTGNGMAASPLGVASGGVNTVHLANNAVTAAKIADGQVVKGINGLSDQVTLQAGVNIAITPAGNTLTVAYVEKLKTPVQGNGGAGLGLGIGGSVTNVLYTVPAGKRLVIEFITADVFVEADVHPYVNIGTELAGSDPVSFRLSLRVEDDDFQKFSFSGLTKLYAQEGTNVTLLFFLSERRLTALTR
jgi:hypothetical protein